MQRAAQSRSFLLVPVEIPRESGRHRRVSGWSPRRLRSLEDGDPGPAAALPPEAAAGVGGRQQQDGGASGESADQLEGFPV